MAAKWHESTCVLILVIFAILLLGLMIICLTFNWVALCVYLLFVIWFHREVCFSVHVIEAFGTAFNDSHNIPFVESQFQNHVCMSLFNDGRYRKLQIHGHLPSSPVVFLVNYPDELLEYFYFGVFGHFAHPVTVLMRDPQQQPALFQPFLQTIFHVGNHIPIPEGNSTYDWCTEKVREHVHDRKRSIWAYPENMRGGRYHSHKYQVCPFRSGIFRIAQQLQIPIVPVVCSYLADVGTRDRTIDIFIGPSILPVLPLSSSSSSSSFDDLPVDDVSITTTQQHVRDFFATHLSELESRSCRPL